MDPDEVTVAALRADPHPLLARLRAEAPVTWIPALGGHLVTSHAAATAVLRDSSTFTVDDPRFSTARVVGPSMLSLDGAEHARHRTPYTARLRSSQRLAPFVAAEARRLVGALRSPAELRSGLAGPLAAAVVAEALGLDGRDGRVVTRLLGWYRDIVASVDGMGAGRQPTVEGARAMVDLAAAVLGDGPPRPDDLTDDEHVANAAVIMFGGIETTEGMILNALRPVLADGPVGADVRAGRVDVASAVDESLRLEPAAAVVDRYATRDVELAGRRVAARDLVIVSLAGANRDPVVFADPDRFDPARPEQRRHLAFAAGPHACIGMDLARREARLAVSAVLEHLPGARLARGAPSTTGLVFRKPATMPVTW